MPRLSRRAAPRAVACTAQKGDRAALPLAALLSLALLTSAVVPEEADAARSGGRVGGSSFSSRRASAPSMGRSGGYSRYAPSHGSVPSPYCPGPSTPLSCPLSCSLTGLASVPSYPLGSGSSFLTYRGGGGVTVIAPSVGYGYGFGMPFFPGFGYGIGMGITSTLFQLLFFAIVAQAVLGAIRNAAGKGDDKDEDSW